MKRRMLSLAAVLLICLLSIAGCSSGQTGSEADGAGGNAAAESSASESARADSPGQVPAYSGKPYIVINDNQPEFEEGDFQKESFESYSDLDSLGRCGVAFANIGTDRMPHKERESIGMIKPSGWKTQRYEEVDGKYLYNRCHLIGYQLTGENANECNLITGTRAMNVDGMLPFENMTADYIKETGNHVLYRVTPIFEGDNLVASGVQMEAESVEDGGEGICFNVYVYNNQPDIEIDYATGESRRVEETSGTAGGQRTESGEQGSYVLNTNTHKFHRPECGSVSDMKAANREDFEGSREDLLRQGYEPCQNCNP